MKMILGRISYEKVHDDFGQFAGMFISAEYLDQIGLPARINFQYDRFDSNLRGRVESVLDSLWKHLPPPEYVTNIFVE